MPLRGVNSLCAQCLKTCKQWKEVVIVCCPNFVSTQKKGVGQDAKQEKTGSCSISYETMVFGGMIDQSQMVARHPHVKTNDRGLTVGSGT